MLLLAEKRVRPMPTVKQVAGYPFFFYSLEGAEPAHIHVE
jgi:hypothetical protein